MMALAPTQVPATAEERVYIEAVLGFEKTQQWSVAITGYRTAIKHWPASLAAHIGLGNSYYAQDDLQQAERVLREASHVFPSEGIVFNNLAQVLWEQGKTTEALRTANKAVSIGGSMAAVYEKTLHEIQSSLADE
jgi:tetratricopeptide (TPR) repeat protein